MYYTNVEIAIDAHYILFFYPVIYLVSNIYSTKNIEFFIFQTFHINVKKEEIDFNLCRLTLHATSIQWHFRLRFLLSNKKYLMLISLFCSNLHLRYKAKTLNNKIK